MAKKKQTFNALMAYLNSLGPIGENVDMSFDKVEYFPQHWRTKNLKQIKLLPIFGTFIWWILEEYGNELYKRTNGEDSTFWVDITIDPTDRSIKLIPKYYGYKESKDNIRFDWRLLRNYYSLSKFMEDRNLEEIIIDYTGHESDFDLTITYNNKQLNGEDTRFFAYDVRMMISEVLETDSWNEDDGGFGVMKLYDQDSNCYLYHTWVKRETTKGEPIILTEKDFE